MQIHYQNICPAHVRTAIWRYFFGGTAIWRFFFKAVPGTRDSGGIFWRGLKFGGTAFGGSRSYEIRRYWVKFATPSPEMAVLSVLTSIFALYLFVFLHTFLWRLNERQAVSLSSLFSFLLFPTEKWQMKIVSKLELNWTNNASATKAHKRQKAKKTKL